MPGPRQRPGPAQRLAQDRDDVGPVPGTDATGKERAERKVGQQPPVEAVDGSGKSGPAADRLATLIASAPAEEQEPAQVVIVMAVLLGRVIYRDNPRGMRAAPEQRVLVVSCSRAWATE